MITRVPLTSNLFLDEYFPKKMYMANVGVEHRLIGLLNRDLVMADQALRDYFGAVTINDWALGGKYNQSGVRTLDSKYYSDTSTHTYGLASDKKFKNATAEEVRAYISKNWQSLKISCIEKNVSWVHSDHRWWRGKNLLIVGPNTKKEGS